MRRYSPTLVEHFTQPRNLGRLTNADVVAEAGNPCCGDRLRLEVRLDCDRIVETGYLAHGCAATIAIGSLLTEAIRGASLGQLASCDETWVTELAGGLSASQRHCAVLAQDVLRALVHNAQVLQAKEVLA